MGTTKAVREISGTKYTHYNYHVAQQWTPGHSSPRNENLRSHRNLYMNAYSSFVQNSPEMETTQMSFSGLNRLWYHGILFSNKKKIMINAYNIQKIV